MTADPVRPQETLRDRIAQVVEGRIDAEPHHRRLYPDLYAADVADAVLPIVEEETKAFAEKVEALAQAAEVLLSDFDVGVFGEVVDDPYVEELRFCLLRLRVILPTSQGDETSE